MVFDWELLGLLTLCFLSATLLPFPSEVAVIVFFSNPNYSAVEIIAVASLGNCLGGCVTYGIGYWSNQFVKKTKWLLNMEAMAIRYGSWMAVLSWVPFIGDPLLTFLGFLKSNPLPTLMFMAIGKIGRYIALYWMTVLAL